MNKNPIEIKKSQEKKEKLVVRIKQLKNELKKIKKQDILKERKDRTKRLIERGAILEKIISYATEFSNEEIQNLLMEVFNLPDAKAIIDEKLKKFENEHQK